MALIRIESGSYKNDNHTDTRDINIDNTLK